MRQIKFRGKRIDNGEWVYGYLVSENLIGDIEEPEYNNIGMGCGIEDIGITDRYDACEYGYNCAVENVFQNVYEVIPESVGQFTEFQDKNGVDIYEGDITKYSTDEPVAVEYRDCCFCNHLKYNDHVCKLTVLGNENKYSVLGNVHDNPELMEGNIDSK